MPFSEYLGLKIKNKNKKNNTRNDAFKNWFLGTNLQFYLRIFNLHFFFFLSALNQLWPVIFRYGKEEMEKKKSKNFTSHSLRLLKAVLSVFNWIIPDRRKNFKFKKKFLSIKQVTSIKNANIQFNYFIF